VKQLLKRLLPGTFEYLQTRKRVWQAYYTTGEWELMELPRYVPRKRLAIDVGGNTGVYTYHLSRLAERVVTFEPHPDYVPMLEALRLPNVTIERAALSSAAGHAELRLPIESGGSESLSASLDARAVPDAMLSRTLLVELKPLDSYGFENVGFIKIDVEGHEEGVLQGAMKTIARDLPVMLVEIEERHNPGGLARISSSLSALGYKAYFFSNRVKTPFESFSLDVHQREAALADAKKNRRDMPYVNNFLFIPPERTA
jgi:FkbM family methyltransferase